MKNINIPEPCSEDWNKMTPNEKGAFCQKCALDVYDFTNKSADEIREVLRVNLASPVCMRIEPKQLSELNYDFESWRIQNERSYQRAWIFTLLVVFGMTLFSCEEDEESIVIEYQKVGLTILNQQGDEKTMNTISSNVAVNELKHTMNSELAEIHEDKALKIEQIATSKESVYEKEKLKEVHVIEEVRVVAEIPLIPQIEEYHEYALGGVPMITHDYKEYLAQTNEEQVTSIEANPQIAGIAYPNPASSQTTIQIKMPKRGKAEINLFSLSGQKIQTIHTGRMKKGENEFSIDLTQLETGVYLVKVRSGEMEETIKFSKI